jgi:hypothetical protein
VKPATCPAGATGALFVTEQPPPSTLEPWEQVVATVTFANCSGATWTAVPVNSATGIKLGGQYPQDNAAWGQNRIALPADVPSGSQVSVAVLVTAPPLTGPYGYGWGVVNEGVGWDQAMSPGHIMSVEARPKMVEICPGILADVGGGAPATLQVQRCVDVTPAGGTLELPAGTYRIDGQLNFTKPLTLRTSGTAGVATSCLDVGPPRCVVLRADDNLDVPRGFVRPANTTDVVFDHIVLDGNRAKRLGSAAARTCASGTNGAGFNASLSGCTGCKFLRGGSVRALCGTAFEWNGNNATIEASIFKDNGENAKQNMWADGLTLLQSNGATVRGCRFIDNSDIGFIFGGGTNALVEDNLVQQFAQRAFAGMMLDNFNGGTSGDFTNTVVRRNRIDCGALNCDYGIELGPHPWYLSRNIIGGTVSENVVSGANFQLNAEGAGTAASPMTIVANQLGTSPTTARFGCGQTRTAGRFNVSPDSVVQTGAGPAPTNRVTHHSCP